MTKQLNPFVKIQRGQDSLGRDDELVFADYSPAVVPADMPDESENVLEPAPKDSSAPAPVVSSESLQTIELASPEATVPLKESTLTDTPQVAAKDSGQHRGSASS